ncbi:conserved Plasmodium protein, unknown function [Plasmodium relictum]|uniref:Inner centromere protein ARK-binding domain-containing protein n=1 Tax=Plasmodium relictum TaxID=85471 RepID=A0A1J1H9T8_PLARL|nr:conserved Plasmodium protein, unknown function [Plasmodium relictum]CRH01684.1 conserved Plasmodium protein, unknown function [Plasmodium relictum]
MKRNDEKRNNISLNCKVGINIQKNISKHLITSKGKHNLQRYRRCKNEFKENLEYTKIKNNVKNETHIKNGLTRSSKNFVLKEDILNENNINNKYSINKIMKEENIENAKEKHNYKIFKKDRVFNYKKYYERVNQWKEKRCTFTNCGNKIKKKEIGLENKKKGLSKILKYTEPKKNTKRKYDKYENSYKQKTTNNIRNYLNEIQIKKKSTRYLQNEKNIKNNVNYNHNKRNNEILYNKKKDKKVVHISNGDNFQDNNNDNKNNRVCDNYINFSCNNNRNYSKSHNNIIPLKLSSNKIRITNKNTISRYSIDKLKSNETILENAEKNICSNKTIINSFDYIDSFNNFSTNPTFLVKSNETIFHAPLKSNLINLENKSKFNLFNKKYMEQGYKNYSTKVRTIPNLNILYPLQKDDNEKIQKNQKDNYSKDIIKNEYLDTSCKMEILKCTNDINITNMKIKLKKETKKSVSMENCKSSYNYHKENCLTSFLSDKEMNKRKKKLLNNVKTSIYNERNILKKNDILCNYDNNFLIKNDLENNNKKYSYKQLYTSKNNISSILNIKNPFICVYENVKYFDDIIVDKKESNKEKSSRTFNSITLCNKNKYISENRVNNYSFMKTNKIEKKNIKNNEVMKIETDKIYSNENYSFNNNIQIKKNPFKNLNLDIENYKMKHEILDHKKYGKKNFKNKKYFKRFNRFHKKKKEKNLIMLENMHDIKEKKLYSDNNYRSLELDNEILNINKHKKLVHIKEKDIKRNFDIFLCLFMKHEKNESFLFCLIFDEELTKYSFFYHNHIKPILDDYKKSKFEKLKKEDRNSTFRDYNCISLNKIIVEIMIPTIKNNYLKYINELYNKKESDVEISSSDELQREIREINKEIKNLEIKSLDKHTKELPIRTVNNYEKKIKLIEKPKWSKEKNLKKLLRKQQNYNPFTIFGTSIKEVNLEEIFTLEVYNHYVTNEDRFQNRILHELYVGNYIKNLYQKINYDEWYYVLDSLKKNWKYFANLECNMLLDPLLLEEILWYIDNNKMYKDKSKEMYIYETCFCPTPDPCKEINLNDTKNFYNSMANKYTSHKEMKYKKLSLHEGTSYSNNLIFKYDEMNREYKSSYIKKKKVLTKENLSFNIPRPSSAIYYDSEFFQKKLKKHIFTKKMKTNNHYNVDSPKCEEDTYLLKFKSNKWISQNFFDNFFFNYYLYNFTRTNRKYNSVI